QGRRQPRRVDDGHVQLAQQARVAVLAELGVPLPGAVAALAADGVPLEDPRPEPGRLARPRLDSGDVALGGTGEDGPAEKDARREARGEVPDLLLRVPADRRLVEVAVALGQVREGERPRADGVVDRRAVLEQHLAVADGGLQVPGAAAVADDAE